MAWSVKGMEVVMGVCSGGTSYEAIVDYRQLSCQIMKLQKTTLKLSREKFQNHET